MPSWTEFLGVLRDNQVGDLTGLLGLVGLTLTFWQVWQAKSAAKASKEAAEAAKNSIHIFDTIVEYSSVISLFEDIKRMHRQPNRYLLLERYASARRMLITIKGAGVVVTDEHRSIVQGAISSISLLEKQLEKSQSEPPVVDAPRYNEIVSKNIDDLLGVLMEIKRSKAGV